MEWNEGRRLTWFVLSFRGQGVDGVIDMKCTATAQVIDIQHLFDPLLVFLSFESSERTQYDSTVVVCWCDFD